MVQVAYILYLANFSFTIITNFLLRLRKGEEGMIELAREKIANASYILITAGAGMGVDSGLPDFRGKEGFWKAYPIAKKLNLDFQELASPKWFDENPKLAWAFYGHRLHLYSKTIPHIGYNKLLKLALIKKDYFVVTSNVDCHFKKAGFDEDKIDEIHGSINHMQCSKPCSSDIWSSEKINLELDLEKFEAKEPLPYCKKCREIARPNILMFNDWNWLEYREKKQREKFANFLRQVGSDSLVILEFGAGIAMPTIRNLSEIIASDFNATLIRVNPQDYSVPDGAISLKMGAKDAIEELIV